MSTTVPMIPPAPLVNWRDLGGLPAGARRVRDGVLWRSDDASFIPAADARMLVEHGLRDIIDLRSSAELDATGRGALGDLAVGHHHVPLTVALALPGEFGAATASQMGEWYAQIAALAAPVIAEGITVTARAEGAVLFHCAAGKDRTGIFAAAVLAVIGVEEDAIIADYARTEERMPLIVDRIAPLLAITMPGRVVAGPRIPAALMTAPATAMAAMLEALRRDHGGLPALLASVGLAEADVAALRARVLA